MSVNEQRGRKYVYLLEYPTQNNPERVSEKLDQSQMFLLL